MSGFFGIFRPQGGPVDLEAFEQMKTAMHREGFEGMETHVEDKIAMGHLMLRVSPESKYDKQPLKSSCGNYLLVGHFRLDYRDELSDKLGLTQVELELTPDSQLVMLSYQKWKEKCVNHLEGDWAFALYSYNQNSVFGAKDKGGYSALFYTTHNNIVYFSSDLNALIEAKIFPVKINKNQLCRIGITGVELTNGKTLYQSIFHVKSANTISVDSSVGIVENEYWQLTIEQSINYKYDFDCFQDMQSLMAQAISSRGATLQEVGVFLSSGLDSTTVAYFSAHQLMFRNKKLFSFTSFPFYKDFDGIKDSHRFREDISTKELLKIFQNVHGNFLCFSNAKYSKHFFDNSHIDYYAPFLTNNTFWLKGFFELAQEFNVKNILNGQLGNYIISWNAPGLDLYYLLRLKFVTFYGRLKFSIQLKGFVFIDFFKKELYRPLRNYFKLNVLNYSSRINDLVASNSIVNLSIVEKFSLTEEKKDFGFLSGLRVIINPRKLRFEIFKKNFTNIGMKWYGLSHSYAKQTSDPTNDTRVVNFSFSIDEQFFNKNGMEKYLLKNVMQSKLPSQILSESNSYYQSIDIGIRLLRDDGLENILLDIKNNEKFKKYVDILSLFSNIDELSCERHFVKNLQHSSKIIKTISLFYFLKRFKYI